MNRKISILLIAVCAILCCGCKEKTVNILALEGTVIKSDPEQIFQQSDSSVVVKNKYDGWSLFDLYAPITDLTPYKAVRWDVENKSEFPLALWVRVVEKGEKRDLLRMYMIDAHTSKTITMELPAPAPHPEVAEEFRLMVNSPYGYHTGFYSSAIDFANNGSSDGSYSTSIDYANIEKIRFQHSRAYHDAEWVIANIEFVEGEKSVVDAMKLSKNEFYPFIDKFGQYKHSKWPGKIKREKEMQRVRAEEEKDLAAHPGPENFSKYGGWADGPRYEATGHFRVEKIDGKWWLIDPEGYLFWSHGVIRVSASCAVTPLEGDNLPDRRFYFEELPDENSPLGKFYHTHNELLKPYYTSRGIHSTYDFSSANLYRKYGEDYLTEFYDLCHRRLRSWGLNTLANSSDKELCQMDRTPYVDRFEVLSIPIEGATGFFWPVPDPYDPSFAALLEKQLLDHKKEIEDPWCIGFFVDNELPWGNQTRMAELVAKAPPTQAAKGKFVADLKRKYVNINALNRAWGTDFASWDALMNNRADIWTTDGTWADFFEFNNALIHKYYSTIRQAFDRLAPGVLYMGCRFAGYTPFLISIGAEYCDVISFNIYDFTLDKVWLPLGVDKPIMISEYHFGAMDRGLFHGSQIDVESQQKRAESYIRYVESALRRSNIIGVHWHQFSDQPASGRFDGENLQVGLTDICDSPYPETVEALRNIGYRMYEFRNSAQ